MAVDLNTLIDPGNGWTPTEASAISDTNWISGVGIYDPDGSDGPQTGYTRLFLVHVPEPSRLTLIGVGGLVLFRRRRFRRRR